MYFVSVLDVGRVDEVQKHCNNQPGTKFERKVDPTGETDAVR